MTLLGRAGAHTGVNHRQRLPCTLVAVSASCFVTNRFGLPATWLGATASYKMASPVLGSYSTHLSPCPGCPANLEMFLTLSEQDQMLLDAF